MFLKPISCKKSYENLIASKIIVWMWVNFFQQCFQILKSSTVINDSNIIREAIIAGKIQYYDGLFTGNFTNTIALELEKLGAKYSKFRKGYLLAREALPTEIIWAIDTAKAMAYAKATAINQYLLNQLSNLDKITSKLVFDEAVNTILTDLQERVYKNAAQHKIELITPKLGIPKVKPPKKDDIGKDNAGVDSKQKNNNVVYDFINEDIAKNYTKNLDFWIKNWTEDEIIKMRSTVAKMAADGKSLKDISNYLIKEFGTSQKHAKFLARNESAMATTSYLVAKYKAEGFTHFKWHTILDGRERDLHKELDGKIFRFDNPPIIDERTGQKGLPSQTYNCRCTFSPYIDKDFLKRRRQMYKAQNSLLGKIKSLWENRLCG